VCFDFVDLLAHLLFFFFLPNHTPIDYCHVDRRALALRLVTEQFIGADYLSRPQ